MKFNGVGFISILIILFTSCEKEYKYSNTGNSSGIDSTQLIKSIAADFGNGDMAFTEHYTYDSTGKQVKLTYTDYTSSSTELGDYNTVETFLNYNTAGLLTSVQRTVPTGMQLDPGEYATSAQIDYDNAGIINKLTMSSAAGGVYSIPFIKTSITGGYRLDWKEIFANTNGGLDTLFQWALFNGSGSCTKTVQQYNDNTGYGYIMYDSIILDSKTDVSKVYAGFKLKQNYQWVIDTTILDFDFTTRLAASNQLYNQRKLLLKGIDQLPFAELQFILNGIMGLFSNLAQDEIYQLYSHPYVQMKSYSWDDNTVHTIQSGATVDAKSRISTLTTNWRESGFNPSSLSVTYYKN